MHFIETRAGKVAYRAAGEGAPVVLLHSAGHDHHDYDAIVPALSRTFRTIAVDWPGFGESVLRVDASRVSTSLFSEALEDLARGLDLRQAIVIGNSVGGAAAIRLAARMPERVRAIVPVDAGGVTPMNAIARAFCWLQGREWVRRMTGMRFAKGYMKLRNTHVDDILTRLGASHRRPDVIAAHAALWRNFSSPASNVIEDARQVQCPTMLVWGRHDPVSRIGVEGARARQAIPHARFVDMATGHVPFAEAPDAFLEHFFSFVDSLEAAGPTPSRAGVRPDDAV